MDARDDLHIQYLVQDNAGIKQLLAGLLTEHAELKRISSAIRAHQLQIQAEHRVMLEMIQRMGNNFNEFVNDTNERLIKVEKLNDLSEKIDDIYNYYHNNYDIVKKRDKLFE